MAASDLDRKYDAVMAAVTGPGGRVILEKDERGRAIVANFPATLPLFFKTFCALYADVEAVIAGDERLTFGTARRDFRPTGARPGCARHRQGRPRRHRDAQLPGLDRCLHGESLKAGAVATLLNGWWQPDELEHALQLTEPKLILADAPRAKRIAATCAGCTVETIAIEQHA